MTTPTMTIMPRASALPTFSRPHSTSLVSAVRICSGTMIPPCVTNAAAVAYAENALAKRRRVQPKNEGASSGPAT